MTLVDLYNNDGEGQHEQVLSDGTGSSEDKETLKWAILIVDIYQFGYMIDRRKNMQHKVVDDLTTLEYIDEVIPQF